MSWINWQIFIFLTILFAGFWGEEKYLQMIVGGWITWTLTKIFTPRLLFTQIIVIGVAVMVTRLIVRKLD